MLNIPSKPISGKGVSIVKVIYWVKEIVDLHWNMGKGDLTTSPHLAKLPSVKGKKPKKFSAPPRRKQTKADANVIQDGQRPFQRGSQTVVCFTCCWLKSQMMQEARGNRISIVSESCCSRATHGRRVPM